MGHELFEETIEKDEVNKMKQYLLQVNRIKLKDYLNCGLIVPDTYLSDNCEVDIQSRNKNYLVLSDGYIDNLDESLILIDVILTNDEITKLQEVDDIFYLDIPLPITRIKKIYVQDNDELDHLFVSIENSESGVIPKELFGIYLKRKKIDFDKKEYKSLPEQVEIKDYTKEIKTYDKRMGMFSFMKNTNIYYSDENNQISKYSDNYFSIFSSLLETPLVEGTFSGLNFLNKYPEFKDTLYSDKQIDKEFMTNFAQNIEDNEIKQLFEKLVRPTGSRDIIKEFAKRDLDIYYFIGLIWYFRQRDENNKLDNLKVDVKDLIPYNRAEVSLAILGIYYGYSRLRTYENIELKDKVFNKIFDTKFNVKFKMDSKLDYIIIETLYQKCFHDKKGYDFEYLDYPKCKYNKKLTFDNKTKRIYSINNKEKYFDVENLKVKKLSILEIFENILVSFSDEIVENKKSRYLVPFVQYNFCKILKVNQSGQMYFSKKDLFQMLESIENKSIINELIELLSIGKN